MINTLILLYVMLVIKSTDWLQVVDVHTFIPTDVIFRGGETKFLIKSAERQGIGWSQDRRVREMQMCHTILFSSTSGGLRYWWWLIRIVFCSRSHGYHLVQAQLRSLFSCKRESERERGKKLGWTCYGFLRNSMLPDSSSNLYYDCFILF